MLRAIGPRRRHPSEKAAGPKASKVYRRYRPKAYGGLAAVGEAPSGLQGRGKWKAWAPELGWVVGQMVTMNAEDPASAPVVPLSARRRGPDGSKPRGRAAEVFPGFHLPWHSSQLLWTT